MKYELDKFLTIAFTINIPHWFATTFESYDQVKEYALQQIEKEGITDYKILEERFYKDIPSMHPDIELYTLRIVK